MSSFAALMALSQSQTQAKAAEVKSQIAERDERQRREKEQRERQHQLELERQAKMRAHKDDQAKREAERLAKKEAEAQALERAREKRQQDQMNKLLGKARHEQADDRERETHSGGASPAGKRRFGKARPRSASPSGGPALTRMEKRAMKMDPNCRPAWAQELVGTRGGARSASPSASVRRIIPKSKPRKASQMNSSNLTPNAINDAHLSIRERLARAGDQPIPLSVNRRDTRTAADYLEEKRQRQLQEEERMKREGFFFNKKANNARQSHNPPKAISPAPIPIKTETSSKSLASRHNSAPSGTNKASSSKSARTTAPPPTQKKKRARTPDYNSDNLDEYSDDYDSEDEPPRKKKPMSILEQYGILKPSHFREIEFSDEDDVMEATAADLHREEVRALKAAKHEDELALQEEMRHEAEKRKRRGY